MLPDLNKLVYCTHSTEYCIVTDSDMACHLCVIAQDAVITNDTVVCNMAVCHDKTVVAHFCCPPFFAAAIYCYELPDGCIIPDLYGSVFALVFKILRNGSDHGAGKNTAVLADLCPFHDGDVASYP